MSNLEIILKNYFHCEKPFDLDGNLTRHGVYHTERLIRLLYDLESIGVISGACRAEREIDEIVGQDCIGKDEKWDYIADIRNFVSEGHDYILKNPFNAKYKDGEEMVIKKIGYDIESKDLFCIISDAPDELDCCMMSDLCFDSITELHEYVLSTEIDNGFDWKTFFTEAIMQKFPHDSEIDVREWVCECVENLSTRADVIREYREEFH